MQPKTKRFRALALIGYFGLLSFVTLWQLVLRAEQPYSYFFIFLVFILPLLLPLPGMVAGKPYTHAWANFIVMFYFLHSLTALYDHRGEWFYALVELLFASMMFIGCSYFARLRGRELGLGLKKASQQE
ncbi:DUF2069 domain-containing protein [Bowmanella sp. JS7-9]|uniref:DUF2069 domain-containing protein n=1 Tax=Pseudobowmanella zhangzhouensis TaxID=1537679 RepID=A0ABW1XLY3_9ALTE|nr:DUF2069 domain-containing protein [Bowmanella sp. JS7-9]TBX23110.1 membrane protein [Bowmanella sp. JS7-9]